MGTYENAVFISYAWGEEREQIVNEIDRSLQDRGLRITRDKRDLAYCGSIKGFMDRIGKGDCIIVIISDKYLKSPNCMYELVEISENKDFKNRIFPVVLADTDVYSPGKQLQYIKHWEEQIAEIKRGIREVDPTNLQGIYEQLDLYARIRANISELTAILRDMNALTPEMHRGSNFSELYNAIELRKVKSDLNQGEKIAFPYFHASPPSLRRTFDALITDKLQNFVGRQFVFDKVDEFLKDNPSGYLVIHGEPGIGKSAFMAKLIHDRGYIHHFNIAPQNIRSSRAFLENVCCQLIARYSLGEKDLPATAYDDGAFLMQCISEAASNPKNHPVVIAVDSLDEADRSDLPASVNSLYLPSSLPEGAYIIITSRPLKDMHLQVMRFMAMDIVADSEGNLEDIDAYIWNFLKRDKIQARLASVNTSDKEFVSELRDKSEGNFMYLYHVLPSIENGNFIENGKLSKLPQGLKQYYERHWREMQEGREKEFETIIAPIVCILGVAEQPVTTRQIATWTKLTPNQTKEYIGVWREFLIEEEIDDEIRYRIYHTSFQDFLKKQVDLKQYDEMISEFYLSLLDLPE